MGKITKEQMKTVLHTAGKLAADPYFLGGVLGAGVFVTDQLFKSSIEMQADENFPHDPVTGNDKSPIELDKKHNTGICCGLLKNNPALAASAAISGLAMLGAGLVFRRKEDFIGKAADMAAMGGAASNLYDRVKRGYVVDYIHVKKGPLSKIVFNIGDVAVAAGAAVGGVTRGIAEWKRQKAYIEKTEDN